MEWRSLTTMAELEQVQKLEQIIWGMQPIPTHQTLTAVKNGGIMLGMFEKEQLIGYSYGFPGFNDGRIYLCSHMLGIDPSFRSQGIGKVLKCKQRELAIEKGFNLIQWTFDPLETRNGHLNLSKLNGICDTYVENCYGEMEDHINKGLPSDRFEVHWHITSPYVEKEQEPNIDHAIPVSTYQLQTNGLPIFVQGSVEKLDGDVYSMDVPRDFQKLKRQDTSLALEWRLQTRAQFKRLFQHDYAAVRLETTDDCSTYYFVKKASLNLGGK